jgi:hypothetical protein
VVITQIRLSTDLGTETKESIMAIPLKQLVGKLRKGAADAYAQGRGMVDDVGRGYNSMATGMDPQGVAQQVGAGAAQAVRSAAPMVANVPGGAQGLALAAGGAMIGAGGLAAVQRDQAAAAEEQAMAQAQQEQAAQMIAMLGSNLEGKIKRTAEGTAIVSAKDIQAALQQVIGQQAFQSDFADGLTPEEAMQLGQQLGLQVLQE